MVNRRTGQAVILAQGINNSSKDDDSKKIELKIETQDDILYTSYIYIGNPPQKLKALFDTGSANSWVAGDILKADYGIPHTYYDPKASTTSIRHNETGSSYYGSGNCFGHYYSDDVYLGLETLRQNETRPHKMIHLKNYKFGVMESQVSILNHFTVDAIIGMGYPSLAEKNVTPIFDAIIQQSHLKHNVFAYSYVYREESMHGFNSELTIGYIDKSKFIEPMKWYPIVKKNFFTIKVDDILFKGKSFGICPKTGCLMTIDSGLTYMIVSPTMYATLQQNNIVNIQECDPAT